MPTLDEIDDRFCRDVELPEKPHQVSYFHKLETGLSLVLTVGYGGSRTFSALTYRDGKPTYTKLGRWPEMKVKVAKDKARQYREDPAKFEAQALPDTFKAVAERWIKAHVDVKKLRSKPEIVRNLTKYIYPKLGNEKFVSIKRSQVSDLLDFIADNHGRSQADASLSIIRTICKWYAPNSDHYVSPIVEGMDRDTRDAKDKARSRILTDDELRAVWGAADRYGSFGAILKLGLLTAQRREKVGSMRWDQIEGHVWTVPQGHREKGTGGSLKLPAMAVEIIAQQSRIVGNPFVFASGESTKFANWSMAKWKLDSELKLPHWTIHDLRRTARSLMSRAGVLPYIAERTLGHVIGGVEGIYYRHSYDVQKADALQRLANLIGTILDPTTGDNVVRFEAANA